MNDIGMEVLEKIRTWNQSAEGQPTETEMLYWTEKGLALAQSTQTPELQAELLSELAALRAVNDHLLVVKTRAEMLSLMAFNQLQISSQQVSVPSSSTEMRNASFLSNSAEPSNPSVASTDVDTQNVMERGVFPSNI